MGTGFDIRLNYRTTYEANASVQAAIATQTVEQPHDGFSGMFIQDGATVTTDTHRLTPNLVTSLFGTSIIDGGTRSFIGKQAEEGQVNLIVDEVATKNIPAGQAILTGVGTLYFDPHQPNPAAEVHHVMYEVNVGTTGCVIVVSDIKEEKSNGQAGLSTNCPMTVRETKAAVQTFNEAIIQGANPSIK